MVSLFRHVSVLRNLFILTKVGPLCNFFFCTWALYFINLLGCQQTCIQLFTTPEVCIYVAVVSLRCVLSISECQIIMNLDLDPHHHFLSRLALPFALFYFVLGNNQGSTEEWTLLSSSSDLESGLFLLYCGLEFCSLINCR